MGRLTLLSIGFALLAPFALLAQFQANAAFANEISQVFLKKGERALESKNYKKAIELCQRAIVSDPADASAFTCLGMAQIGFGNQDGQRYFDIALSIDPHHSKALLQSGRVDLAKGLIESVRKKLALLQKTCGKCVGKKRDSLEKICGECADYIQLKKSFALRVKKRAKDKKN